MLDTAKSLSTHARLAPNPLQTIQVPVEVTFTLTQDGPEWTFVPLLVKSGDLLPFEVIYNLNSSSTPGWDFTKVTIEDFHQPPAWSFTCPNSSDINRIRVENVLDVTATLLDVSVTGRKSISLLIDNLNNTDHLRPVSVKLTVSDSQGRSFTSPDPQIILEPR